MAKDIQNIINQARKSASAAEQEHHKHASKKVIAAVIGIIAAVGIIGAMLFIPWEDFGKTGKAVELGVTTCEDKLCFIHHGKYCLPATYTMTDTGITIKQTVRNDCTLTREVTNVVPDASDQVHALTGMSMTCTWTKGHFNPRHSDTLTGAIPQCDGPLLDAMLDIAFS